MSNREFDGVKINVEFNETANRQQISSGDNLNTLFGKIRKWLSDLKPVALSGSYSDLSDKPTSLPASDTTSDYYATGTAPVNGTAVNKALQTLDVSSKGGAGKYIQSISETDGKINAVEKEMPTSLPANGGTAQTISDTLPISKGGTGKTTANEAFEALVNGLPEAIADPVDGAYFITKSNIDGVNTWHRRSMVKLWNYIKSKFIKKSNKTEVAKTKLDVGFYDVEDGEIGYGKGNYHSVINMGQHDNPYLSQISMPYQNTLTDTEVYVRTENDGTWRPWRRLLHDGNFSSIIGSTYATKASVDDLKKSVSDGKAAVAGSITDKGVTTAADATFATMVTNIGKIETCLQWKNTSNGTYKFVQNGNRWVANNRGINSSIATSEWEITLPKQMDYEIGYRTATESADKLVITIDGETIVTKSGLMTEENAMVCVNQSAGKHILTATYTKDGSVHSYGDMAYVILPPIGEQAGFYKYQSKSITPSSSAQTVYPDTGYDGLYSVSIAASSGVKKLTYVTGSMSFAYVAGGKKVTTLGKPRIIVVARGSSSLTSNNISGVALYLLDEDDTVLVHQGKQVLTNITDTSFNLYNISSNSAKYTYMYGYRA